MMFILCIIASIVGIVGCLYAAPSFALFFRREWKDGFSGLAISILFLGIYAVAWQFLPLGNWLIVPGLLAAILSAFVFALTLKSGA